MFAPLHQTFKVLQDELGFGFLRGVAIQAVFGKDLIDLRVIDGFGFRRFVVARLVQFTRVGQQPDGLFLITLAVQK